MNNYFNEYKELFLEEADEYITALNENLIAIEKDKKNHKLIDNIFRIAHTLKSSAAAVGLDDLSNLAHKSEDLMHVIREGTKHITTEITDTLFEIFDIIKEYLKFIREDKTPDVNIDKIIKKLETIIKTPQKKEELSEKKDKKKKGAKKIEFTLGEYDKQAIIMEKKEGSTIYQIEIEIDEREQLKWLRAELIINKIKTIGEMIQIVPKKEEFILPDFNGKFLVLIATKKPKDNILPLIIIDLIKNINIIEYTADDLKQLKTKEKKPVKNTFEKSEDTTDTPVENVEETKTGSSLKKKQKFSLTSTGDTIRVPVKKLDTLMNLVGELVITNSGLKILEQKISTTLQDRAEHDDLVKITDKLFNITSDLQYNIMNTRMIPISHSFHQFSRVIRDLTKDQDKDINLILNGEETELDKKMIDRINDPLMHLVRNSIDHGIESKTERKKIGKNPQGTIILSAKQVGNHIIISIKDDGKGINVSKVNKIAVKKGLISEKESEKLTKDQILEFIFHPGFSTADKISNVSGRGVGLDVVQNVVQDIGGTIDIVTTPGKKTEFLITLPLTLAISSVILVESNDIKYGFPISDIETTLRITKDEIQYIDGKPAINLRDEILPLISLKKIFEHEKLEFSDTEKISIIVVTYQNHKAGVIIQKIIGEQEIVLKPLEGHYKSVKGLSGAAIIGDGSIILVLDIIGIIKLVKNMNTKAYSTIKSQNSQKNIPENKTAPDIKKTISLQKKSEVKKEVEIPEIINSNSKLNEQIEELFLEAFQEAAISLSQLTHENMSITCSSIEFPHIESCVNHITDNMEMGYFASIVKVTGYFKSNIVFLISKDDGLNLFDSIIGNKPGYTKNVNEEVISGIGEVNNILSSIFINNIANIIKKEINPTIPINKFDMLGALLEGIIMQKEVIDKKILYADTIIQGTDMKKFHSRLLILSDKDKLIDILKKAR